MIKMKQRPYKSLVRERQADDTRRRIVEATRQLLERDGYAGMTVSAFGAGYEKVVRQALSASDPEARLRFAARIARQIHDAQSATFDLLRGAGVVAPELAKLEQQREGVRYERQETMINLLRDAGRLRPGLDHGTARDIFWMFTGRDVYRMLVRERGWSPQKYQDWLADTLVHALLKVGPLNAVHRGDTCEEEPQKCRTPHFDSQFPMELGIAHSERIVRSLGCEKPRSDEVGLSWEK